MLKGDSLNALFEQLAGPKISPSAYRLNSFELDADMVRKIPFFYGPNQATIAMSRIIPTGKWPIALRGPEFATQRRNYEPRSTLPSWSSNWTGRPPAIRWPPSSAVRDLAERLDQVISPEKETSTWKPKVSFADWKLPKK